MFIIQEVIMYKMKMEMKSPFTTSFGTQYDREFILVEVKDENGLSGWGECVTSSLPLYSEEYTNTAWIFMKECLIPLVVHQQMNHPDEVFPKFEAYKGNYMAKSAVEGAIWDLYAKSKGTTLAKALGGSKQHIESGISLGIQENTEDLLQSIKKNVDEGYKRIKVKIEPGRDVSVVKEIRKFFPDLPLMVDANSAYTLDDVHIMKELDRYNLLMIEQPLTSGDLIDHATLQQQISTPICLDESIHCYREARQAIELGSCKIINVKIGRVGGLTEAKRIHDLCKEHGIALWCGGMLESGVGRAHNIAIATLANFTYPGDTASSDRYWEEDVISPLVEVHNGTIMVPQRPGIGYEVDLDIVNKYVVEKATF
ncbi:o-succinylbenzoate synthase [Pontibacillus litoralis]|uniref:o-succinylbenzoate synthase n=1 Tax=Pontibacillus litoralis JSM 072002 TaxID=1385512 RepID=A0A0A5G5B5_9BACI|nr:o-succinylbenzoate synthase [Pontibacillus litoralis]KGX86348.1 O-succinylbenzoate synthase [Pontibacillus litoralis JSM 072002]